MAGLPQALRRLRRERGVTQQEVGAATGRKTQTVSNWEKGRTEIPASVLGAYLDCLGCDLLDLDRALRGLDPVDLPAAPPPEDGELPATAPEKTLSEADQDRIRTEIQLIATRAASLLLAAKGWSHTEAARRCGWAEPDRISKSIERGTGWTLEKLAVLSTAAGIDVARLLGIAFDSLEGEREAARRRLRERADGDAIVAMIRCLPREERERILGDLENELRASA